MKRPVYLDHHATTPCDARVVEAMLPYFTDQFGNAHARHHANGRAAKRVLEAALAEIGGLLGAAPEHIQLTSGATAANHQALRGVTPQDGRNELCISALEHDSVVQAAKASGLTMRVIPANTEGFITPEALAEVLNPRTLLVSVQAANHEIGTIQPIAALAELAHRAGALFHCDATQAVGKMPLDCRQVDMLSFTAHKLYAPQGIGALYVRPDLAVAPLHGGTIPLPLAVGFGAACKIAAEEMAQDAEHLQQLGAALLNELPDYQLNGAAAPRLAGSLNLRFAGCNAEDVLLDVAEELCLATGAACASASREPSRVLRAIGLDDTAIAASIRLAFGRFNTLEEARFAGRVLNSKTQPLRPHPVR